MVVVKHLEMGSRGDRGFKATRSSMWFQASISGPRLGSLLYDMDSDLSDAEFERRHGFFREVLKKVKQQQLDQKNMLQWGASIRGGYTLVEQEKAAKFLVKQEVSG